MIRGDEKKTEVARMPEVATMVMMMVMSRVRKKKAEEGTNNESLALDQQG